VLAERGQRQQLAGVHRADARPRAPSIDNASTLPGTGQIGNIGAARQVAP
jgi:hypothetical protein